MYKLKNLSVDGVTIKFSKQSEVNYQSVCVLNELQPALLLPFDFIIKHFKIVMEYHATGYLRFSDILRSGTDAETVVSIVRSVLRAVDDFSSVKVDSRGLILRTDCIFMSPDGQVRLIYAPAFAFDEANTMAALKDEILSISKLPDGAAQRVADCFGGNPSQSGLQAPRFAAGNYNESGTTVLSGQGNPYSAPVYNEGETTILSASPAPESRPAAPQGFHEGETTILSASPAPENRPAVPQGFHEGETTILRAAPSVNPIVEPVQNFHEGETTVLSALNVPSPSPELGETTLLSPQQSPQQDAPVGGADDDFNENATCLLDDSFDEPEQPAPADNSVNNFSGVPDFDASYSENPTVMCEEEIERMDNLIDSGLSNLQPDAFAHDAEGETTIPGVGDPLRENRTLIGAEGLAQAMAYSSIRANEQASENYETVLLSDDSTDKTAFFIRFINSQAVYITKNYFTIGSGPDMDYMISGNSLISKYHATVVIEDSRFFIIDNNSTNKVYVDGREAVPFEKNEIFTGSRIVLANEIFDFYIK